MSSILIGIDSSASSARAVELGLQMAVAEHADVLIVHAIPWSPYSFQTAQDNEVRAGEREREIDAATTQLLDPALARAKAAGVRAEGITRHGHPVELLVDLAEERKVDHIVIGRTGESRVKQVLYGGLPARLIMNAPVAVTVVP
jgi:nucleotide-binding universal stress UspA family protein